MADSKISALPASTTPLAGTEVLPIVQSSATKQVSVANLTAGRAVSAASLTTSGNAAIGTSLTSQNTITGAAEVGTSAMLLSFSDPSVGVGNNFYFNGGWKYKTTGKAQQFQMPSGGNDLAFLYAASGSAAGAISWATAFSVANGNVTVDAGNLVIGTSGKGVDFSATSGTGTSELLADYEEGTWTMGIAFGGGTTGITYTVNTGRYIKVGKSVTVTGLLLLSNKGSSTGAAQISGLPYTIGAGNPSQSAAAVRLTNITFIGQYHAVGDVGATTVALGADTELGVGSGLTDTNFANNSLIQISYTYFVD